MNAFIPADQEDINKPVCSIFVRYWFFTLCLKLFVLPDLLISIGSLFHNDGLLYDVLFKPLFEFLKGCFNLWKGDCVFMLLGSTGKWILSILLKSL